MKKKIILDKNTIEKIRLNIEIENKNKDKRTKALLFSDEIKKICNQEIKDFKHKEKILKPLLLKFIDENELNCDDIYQQALNEYKDDDELYLDISNYISKNTKYDSKNIKGELKRIFNKQNSTKIEDKIDLKENKINEDIEAFRLNLKYLDDKNILKRNKHISKKRIALLLLSLFLIFFVYELKKSIFINNKIIVEKKYVDPYEYKEFNYEKLKKFLREKNSLLAEDIYFNQIILASKEKNLNPLILFAIASHEQGYVKKDHPDANKIINNPFNVFYSWKKYNTNLKDSSTIAATTVYNLSLDRPKNVKYFKWINRKYAQDENWHKGVSWIFNKMQEIVLDEEEKIESKTIN